MTAGRAVAEMTSSTALWRLERLPEPAARPVPVVLRAEVIAHDGQGDRYRLLRLHAPAIAESALPGQFVMLTVAREGEAEPVLPRPMAVYSTDQATGAIEILYGVVGVGTRRLATFRPAEVLTVVGPLGRWFELGAATASVLLVGRGIGTCSLTTVLPYARSRGVSVTAVASGRHPAAVVGAELYREGGVRSLHEVTDADGTSDPDALFHRLVAGLDAPPDLLLTCGSRRLVGLCERLAQRWPGTEVQVSVEAHMACGLGYCHGCASGSRSEGEESPLICRDGPVFAWRPDPGSAGHPGRAT